MNPDSEYPEVLEQVKGELDKLVCPHLFHRLKPKNTGKSKVFGTDGTDKTPVPYILFSFIIFSLFFEVI